MTSNRFSFTGLLHRSLPRGSLARHLLISLVPPIVLLVLLDLFATWVFMRRVDLTLRIREDFFWLILVCQALLVSLFVLAVLHGLRSGLRSVNHLSAAIRQRSIDDMQPLEVADVPIEIA